MLDGGSILAIPIPGYLILPTPDPTLPYPPMLLIRGEKRPPSSNPHPVSTIVNPTASLTLLQLSRRADDPTLLQPLSELSPRTPAVLGTVVGVH